MTREHFDSVWDAIEDEPAQAENLKLRSALMMALISHIRKQDLPQSKAAVLLDVTQPDISNLMRGKIDLFGLDTLVNMVAAAGIDLNVREAGLRPL